MGFFKKIWKGIKSGVKSIGKGIKSAAQKVGKFMDKIGVVGQIALMFILPGVGAFLGKGITALQGMGGLAGSVGNILSTAGKFASTVGNAFKTVTDGIFNFVGKVGGSFVNQVATKFGAENLVFKNAASTVGEGFGKWMEGVASDVSNITSPFKVDNVLKGMSEQTSASISDQWEKSFTDPQGSITGSASRGSGVDLSNTFDKAFDIPDVEVINNKSAFTVDLPTPEAGDVIIDAENKAAKGFLSSVTDFTKKSFQGAGEKAVDQFTSQITRGVATKALNATGLGGDPAQFTTNVNNIPEFNSSPITQLYEQNGFGYGATPDNRIQFFAAQNQGGDFGANSFTQFSQLGVR